MNIDRHRFFVGCSAIVAGWSLNAAEPSDFDVQQRAVQSALRQPVYPGPAKNIILFLGDGMGMTTITGARILAGQELGKLGEEHTLSFETFEHTAFSKTYTINQQTPDSAGTMTAIMTGHKTNAYVINYDQKVELGNHETMTEYGGTSKALPILTEELEKQGIRKEDLFISISPTQREDWSFGNGVAQLLQEEANSSF